MLEKVINTRYEINDSTKTFIRTLSNPLSPKNGQLIDPDQLNKADHIFVIRPGYTHHGIYVGNGKVVHYAPTDFGEVCIFETTIDEFRKWLLPFDSICDTELYKLYRFKKSDSPIRYTSDEVVNRAYSRIWETEYNLVFNNCEHFARWCRCNQSY